MVQVAALPIMPNASVVSSAASDGGPALHIRRLRSARTNRQDYKPGRLDVTLLGLTIVLGGQCFSWNASLAAGMLPATAAFVVVGAAYVVLVFSLAEIASVFPFSGGAYAVARKTLGFAGGFLIGAIDVFAFITYVSASVLTLGQMVTINTPALRGLEPIVWLLFYLSATVLQCRSHWIFWRTTALLATISLATLVIFCIGALPYGDLRKSTPNATDTARPPPSIPVLIARVLPFSAWFFAGVDAVVLVSDHVRDPRVTMPRAQRRAMTVITGTALLTFFVACALPSGLDKTASETLVPLSVGFTTFMPLSATQATWLSVPPTYATAFGFVWAYGRLLTSLAASGLLPRWLVTRIQQQTQRNQSISCRTSLKVGSLLSFLVCLLVHYDCFRLRALSNVSLGLSFFSYCGQTLAYIVLRQRRRMPLAHSAYPSPFGLVGAYASLLVWVVAFISVVGAQNSGGSELMVILTLLLVLVVYYYQYARHHELFSADERDVAMAAVSSPRSIVRTGIVVQASSAGAAIQKSKVPKLSDADGSFNNTGRTSSSSSMPQLVRTGSKLNNLREEDAHNAGVTDDLDEPYVANWPPSSSTEQSQSATVGSRNSIVSVNPLRRAGSDGVLASSFMSSPLPPMAASPTPMGILSHGFGRSFLLHRGRLERLREETDRDLRSAVSGIWSERSQRGSDHRGRPG
jgi:ethanolamine permease